MAAIQPTSRDVTASMNHRAGVRNTQLLMVLALIILLATAIRYYPIAGASAAPSGFSGPGAFGYYTLLGQGNDPTQPTPVYSAFDFGVNTGRGEILFVRLQVLMAMLLGYDRYADGLFGSSILESTMLTAGLLLVGWIWTKPGQKDERGRRKDPFGLVLLICFVAGTPTIILFAFGANAAYGWLLICLTISLWRKPPPTTKHRALAMGMTLALFPLYSTAAMMLLILTIVFAAFNWQAFSRYAAAITVFAIAYYAYLSQQVFGTVLLIPSAILSQLQTENTATAAYAVSNPFAVQILNLAVYGTFGILLLMAGYPRLSGQPSRSDIRLSWTFIVSCIVFGVGASSALGITKGIFRVPEYLTILSLLAIPSLSRRTTPRFRHAILVSLATVVVISVSIHLTSQTVPAQFISPQEVAADDWIMSGSGRSVVVFSDFRLAGPLVAHGYLKVIGVSGTELSPNVTNQLLIDIYYSENPCSASKGLKQVTILGGNQTFDLLLVSSRMTSLFPGITGTRGTYEPAPSGFTSTYDAIPSMGRLYDNGQAQVYGNIGPSLQLC
ncbi:MAG TPA: hypothetical protein VF944_01010 [Candidatus Bathyarchaeia archaeon]